MHYRILCLVKREGSHVPSYTVSSEESGSHVPSYTVSSEESGSHIISYTVSSEESGVTCTIVYCV